MRSPIGFRDKQSPQSSGRYHERFDWLLGLCIDECGPPASYASSPMKPPGLRDDLWRGTRAVALADLDLAGENDGETLTDLADLGQRRPSRECTNIAETPSRSISAGSSVGNIWWRRASMTGVKFAAMRALILINDGVAVISMGCGPCSQRRNSFTYKG